MQRKTATVLISLLCAAVAVLGVLSGWLYAVYESPEERAAKERVWALTDELAEANGLIGAQESNITNLESSVDALMGDLAAKTAEIEKLESEISVLLDADAASDEYQKLLLDRIASLRAEADATLLELQTLQGLIRDYKNIITLDFGKQARKTSELLLFLAEDNRPMHITRTEITDEETGEVIETLTEESIGNISFYYRDIATGYTLSYDAEEVMYSASLVKVPYVYVLLKSVADFEYTKRNFDSEGNPLFDEDGEPLFEGAHPNLDADGRIIYNEGEEKYDLSRVWTFNKETMMREGSGKLCEMEDGTQLSYLELIEYAVLYSDNIAFYELCQEYGYIDYYAAARQLSVNGIANGFMKLSAADCGKFMQEIYAFIEDNETYGSLLKQSMINSNYPVLIPYCVSPIVAAHKYGWDLDAYHDMAIVYDEHPYILVIMTDLDTGGKTVNTYVQKVVRMIHSIHETFYEGVEVEFPMDEDSVIEEDPKDKMTQTE